MVMENRVQYIIDLVVQDKKLRQKMAQLNWEDLIGSNGKDLSDLFGSEAEDAIKKLKTIKSSKVFRNFNSNTLFYYHFFYNIDSDSHKQNNNRLL